YGVATVDFANGTVWQAAAIAANTYITAASSTTGVYDTFLLTGTIKYDLGVGTFGNVNASRDYQGVQVIWGAGDSSQQFTINCDGNGNNVGTTLLNNLNLSDVSFYRSGSTLTDLTIKNKAPGATLPFPNTSLIPSYGVATINFANGTVWQAAAI